MNRQGIYADLPESSRIWQYLSLDLRSDSLPDSFRVVLRLWNGRCYRQDLRPPAGEGLALLSAGLMEGCWEPIAHEVPWHHTYAGMMRQLGVLALGAPDSTVFLRRAELQGPVGDWELRSRALGLDKPAYVAGKMVEFGAEAFGTWTNPFDMEEITFGAWLRRPGRALEWIDGFYDRSQWPAPGEECGMQPNLPRWKLRFLPMEAGEYQLFPAFSGRELQLLHPEIIQVGPGDCRGYLQVADHRPGMPRSLEYQSGDPFFSIGINAHSPKDKRLLEAFPGLDWGTEGYRMYKRLFPKFKAAGINTAEVWMTGWSFGLEWRKDRPGYNGLGYYHQEHAAQLDSLLFWAEQNDIYLIFVLNHHGQFSGYVDSEWHKNPYSSTNRGPAANPEWFFEDASSAELMKRRLRYIAARYGWSDHILAWKLLNEINLTGCDEDFARDQRLVDWHREMTAYLKFVDEERHMIAAHWCADFRSLNSEVADLPDVDLLAVDAYHDEPGAAALLELLKGSYDFAAEAEKPLMITEYGGRWNAGDRKEIYQDLHLGLWYGSFRRGAGAPMLWWLGAVDRFGWYPEYRFLRDYWADAEADRKFLRADVPQKGGPAIVEARSENEVYLWLFDPGYYFQKVNRDFEPCTISLVGLRPGSYSLEIWNNDVWGPFARRQVEVEDRMVPLKLEIPPFLGDLWLKLRRLPREEAHIAVRGQDAANQSKLF